MVGKFIVAVILCRLYFSLYRNVCTTVYSLYELSKFKARADVHIIDRLTVKFLNLSKTLSNKHSHLFDMMLHIVHLSNYK